MAKNKISNYRLSPETKDDLKKIGISNESKGIRLAVRLWKTIGARKARKILEGKCQE